MAFMPVNLHSHRGDLDIYVDILEVPLSARLPYTCEVCELLTYQVNVCTMLLFTWVSKCKMGDSASSEIT